MKIISDEGFDRVMQARQDDGMILQNPFSLIGATKRVIPYGPTGRGWWAVLTWTVTILALILAWAVVLAWYALLTGFAVLWIPWGIYTLNRRHHIHDQLRAAMQQQALTR